MKFFRFLVYTLLVLQCSLLAQEGGTFISKYAGEFLTLGVGGRSMGMGGAAVALSDDVTAGYWNPAGLARMNYPQIALMHENHFGDLVKYNYGAAAIPYGKDMSFGISIIRLSIDGIPDTREAGYNAVTGEKLGPDAYNNPYLRLDYSKIKDFSNADYAVYLTFAKRHSDDFYWGANIKLIKRDLAEFSATGIGFDVGAYYKATERLHLGANLQDATTTLLAWNTEAGTNELISPTLKIGAAYALDLLGGYLTPAMDFDIRFEGREFASNFNIGPVSFDVHSGLEYNYKNIFSIRGGYSDVKQLTIGAGINLPKLTIDYSFAKFNESDGEGLDNSHRISLILTLEEPRFLRKGI